MVVERVGVVRVIDKFKICFVNHNHHARRHPLQKRLPVRPGVDRAGGIIGVIQKNNACINPNRLCHGVQIKGKAGMWNGNRAATGRVHAQMINGKGVLRRDNRFAHTQKGPHDHLDQFVRAVTNNDPRPVQPKFLS